MIDKNSNKQKKQFCAYCDFTGIIRNSGADELGIEALTPCPKCVESSCKCGGKEPYYYMEGREIKECSCRYIRAKIQRAKNIYSNSGIEKKYRWRFLDIFNKNNEQASKAWAEAYNVIHSFPNVKKGLFLWGNPGTGKTLLSTIILTELISRFALGGKFVKISRNFFGKLRSSFVEGSANYGMSSRIEQEFAEVDVLVLDDFGTQRDSRWEQETLYNLVDARYESEKFTLFTSNHNPNETMKELFEGRILSRIKEMCKIIEISGEDYREKL